ncbi:hypothetical protein HanXRQr2_Chr13g0566461 [Helianthus annuus]|uniref:Uncharacterized protein n=1 Tax=Helianthus annuus TaxID=4232 RepID=A0A251SMK8_HELAN|nr:hypothetical protein HanXRQr2_Chr13g0566461 [Helianthus annuus]KAJ0847449.1 hypothetical protein HanPSC8_Chr13g0545471 [Helianthus annuus]
MASILKERRLATALIILIVAIATFHTISMVDARTPYNHARQLATDCNSPKQGEVAGCGGGGGSNGSSRPGRPSGPAPGSSRCRKGCCGKNKLGQCICCK